jgi:hypothetical protein
VGTNGVPTLPGLSPCVSTAVGAQKALGPNDNRHYLGRYFDINQVIGIDINNTSGSIDQPEVVRQFSYYLANKSIGGASQVIQPWMT